MYLCLDKTNTDLKLCAESPKIGDNVVSGYFSDIDNEIVVGISTDSWIEVLVHEFCHYIQCSEECKEWQSLEFDQGNACDLMWRWIDKEIELKEKEINLIFKRVQSMELDCERRTVSLIKKYKLPIDLKTYIAEANIYVYFYNFAAKHRMWFPNHIGPNSFKKLYSMVPTTMRGSRSKMPQEFYDIYGSLIFCNRQI